MTYKFKFVAGVYAEGASDDLFNTVDQVTIENMDMAAAELKSTFKQTLSMSIKSLSNVDDHIFYLNASQAGVDEVGEVHYRIADRKDNIVLTPIESFGPFVNQWGFVKEFKAKKVQKPVVSEEDDAIAEAAAAEHEESKSEQQELFDKFMTTDMTAKEYKEANHVQERENLIKVLVLRGFERKELLSRSTPDLQRLVLAKATPVKPATEDQPVAEQNTTTKEESTMTQTNNSALTNGAKQIMELHMQIGETNESVSELTKLIAAQQEMLIKMQEQLNAVKSAPVQSAQSVTPEAVNESAATSEQEPVTVPVLTDSHETVLKYYGILVGEKLLELDKEPTNDNITQWATDNVEDSAKIGEKAKQMAACEYIVQMDGFKDLMKYLKENFKIMNKPVVKAAFFQIDSSDDAKLKAVVTELRNAYNNDEAEIAGFFKAQMGRFFNITFKGAYQTGVSYTANSVSFLAQLNKTLMYTIGDIFYVAGDAGEKAGEWVADKLRDHAGADKQTSKESVAKAHEKATKIVPKIRNNK